MLRILIAAGVLFAAAYFYLNQGEDERPLEAQQQALEKAKAVEKTVQDQAKRMQQQIDAQTDDDDGKP